jgi:glycosyltransferase involved in cell wall biosynthesis
MLVSIIIPVCNEQDNVFLLCQGLVADLKEAGFQFEVIFINDGSTDNTQQELLKIAAGDSRFTIVELKRNFGQTAALMAGFDSSAGDVIIPMDGDLQNNPKDIPTLVRKLDEGYDLCSGWRKERKDPLFSRKIPSWWANKLISMFTGIRLHDYGCTMKAYRREIIEGVRLYGEMHRFLPIYASWQGARITEIPILHYPRTSGKSKYGFGRVYKTILDLMVLLLFSALVNNPIYIFGGFGLMSIFSAFLTFGVMLYYKFCGNKTFIETPLPQLTVLFFLIGFISIFFGLLAEVLMRTYYESQGKSNYSVKSVYNMGKQ